MARIDPLLKMIVAQGGNEMVLRANEQPQLFHSGSPLRLFLPPMSARMLNGMIEPLLDPETQAAWRDGEAVDLAHTHAEYGAFAIRAEHPGTRITLRIKTAEPKPAPRAPTPAPAASPPAASIPASPVAAAAPASPAPRRLPTDPRILPAPLLNALQAATDAGASDLHLADDAPAMVRTTGRLRALPDAIAVTPLVPALLHPAEQQILQTDYAVDFSFALPDGTRVRGHVFHHLGGMAAAFRILARRAPALATLGLPVDLQPLMAGGPGLVIVSGPTGSGKSTTLAALAQGALQRDGGLLITLEDPIEHVYAPPAHGLVRQRAIGAHAKSFSSGLRGALREDPDIILVGEMRDAETIRLALTAAETGHRVLTTLHSRDTASAIARMLDAVPAEGRTAVRGQIAAALKGVIAQRLVPAARGDGRVPVLEVLRPTTGVRALIRDGKLEGLASALQSGGNDGMIALARCAVEQVRAGRIAQRDAEALFDGPAALKAYL